MVVPPSGLLFSEQRAAHRDEAGHEWFDRWANEIRAERARLQQLYADAYAAAVSYQEFPFMIRRRRAPLPGQEQIGNDEPIRIADALQAVQEKLSNYTAQIRAESIRMPTLLYGNELSGLRLCWIRVCSIAKAVTTR